MGLMDLFRRGHKGSATDGRLVGVWTLVKAAANIDPGDGCQMEIRPDGTMDYIIRDGDRLQIMKLIYRVEGNALVTDQPSKPRAERTPYRFDGGELVLSYGGDESRFERSSERWSPLPSAGGG
jgi:hypothetical protein